MFKARVRLFGATWESVFPRPIPLARIAIDRVAEGLLDGLSPIGITPDQIALVKSNDLFGYELRFPMFRGNGAYSLNSQRLHLDFMNAVGPADVTTIIDTILKCLRPIDLPRGTKYNVSIGRQCEFVSPGDFEGFLATQGAKWSSRAVKQAGAILHVVLPEWPTEIIITIERSILITAGVWIHTRTIFDMPEPEDQQSNQLKSRTAEALRGVSDIFEKAVSECNLELVWQ
jgi:hypothetical protein